MSAPCSIDPAEPGQEPWCLRSPACLRGPGRSSTAAIFSTLSAVSVVSRRRCSPTGQLSDRPGPERTISMPSLRSEHVELEGAAVEGSGGDAGRTDRDRGSSAATICRLPSHRSRRPSRAATRSSKRRHGGVGQARIDVAEGLQVEQAGRVGLSKNEGGGLVDGPAPGHPWPGQLLKAGMRARFPGRRRGQAWTGRGRTIRSISQPPSVARQTASMTLPISPCSWPEADLTPSSCRRCSAGRPAAARPQSTARRASARPGPVVLWLLASLVPAKEPCCRTLEVPAGVPETMARCPDVGVVLGGSNIPRSRIRATPSAQPGLSACYAACLPAADGGPSLSPAARLRRKVAGPETFSWPKPWRRIRGSVRWRRRPPATRPGKCQPLHADPLHRDASVRRIAGEPRAWHLLQARAISNRGSGSCRGASGDSPPCPEIGVAQSLECRPAGGLEVSFLGLPRMAPDVTRCERLTPDR